MFLSLVGCLFFNRKSEGHFVAPENLLFFQKPNRLIAEPDHAAIALKGLVLTLIEPCHKAIRTASNFTTVSDLVDVANHFIAMILYWFHRAGENLQTVTDRNLLSGRSAFIPWLVWSFRFHPS